MDEDDFEEALESAAESISEDARMKVAKSIFSDVCVNTNQVVRIVEELFIDEDRKLEFAKYAFSRTADKDKYFRVNKVFISEQRKADLSDFVQDNK